MLNINNYSLEDIEKILKENFPNTSLERKRKGIKILRNKKIHVYLQNDKIVIYKNYNIFSLLLSVIIISFIWTMVSILLKIKNNLLTSFIIVFLLFFLIEVFDNLFTKKEDKEFIKQLSNILQKNNMK